MISLMPLRIIPHLVAELSFVVIGSIVYVHALSGLTGYSVKLQITYSPIHVYVVYVRKMTWTVGLKTSESVVTCYRWNHSFMTTLTSLSDLSTY
jgi:hypothetical protein